MELDSVTLGNGCRARVTGSMTIRGHLWLGGRIVVGVDGVLCFERRALGIAGRLVHRTHGDI